MFELALRWDWLHELEHASFFATGLLFWWPVVQPWPSTPRWPRWSIPLYLFCATLPCDVLSGFLVFCDRVVYSSYLSAPRLFGISPLQDQECAAALMWVWVTIIFLVPAVVVTIADSLAPEAASCRRNPGPSCRELQATVRCFEAGGHLRMAAEPTIARLERGARCRRDTGGPRCMQQCPIIGR